MSDTVASVSRKIKSAGDLQSVVRTMKAMAASSIGQYERSVRALADYDLTVKQGLTVCLRHRKPSIPTTEWQRKAVVTTVGTVVFGSDQGLVGQFNDVVAERAIQFLTRLPVIPQIWAVGERVHARLADAGLPLRGQFPVPNSVKAITPLVGRILVEYETQNRQSESTSLDLFFNRPVPGAAYAPVYQRLLPPDDLWHRNLADRPWPTKNVPEVVGAGDETFRALIREYVFVSLFRACAESLASENASRLAAMERADTNIDEILQSLRGTYHRLRQGHIDEELFDVVSGFEASSR